MMATRAPGLHLPVSGGRQVSRRVKLDQKHCCKSGVILLLTQMFCCGRVWDRAAAQREQGWLRGGRWPGAITTVVVAVPASAASGGGFGEWRGRARCQPRLFSRLPGGVPGRGAGGRRGRLCPGHPHGGHAAAARAPPRRMGALAQPAPALPTSASR